MRHQVLFEAYIDVRIPLFQEGQLLLVLLLPELVKVLDPLVVLLLAVFANGSRLLTGELVFIIRGNVLE